MPKRITRIAPPRNPSLDRQDDIIRRLRADPGAPLIDVPADVARAVRAVASIEFGGHCTFVQLLHACLSLPEFAWWASPENAAVLTPREKLVQDAIDASTPADDRLLYKTVRPATPNPEEIALMITEAIRQSPDWTVTITPPTQYGSQRLVFRRHAPS